MRATSDYLPWQHGALDAAVGQAFQAAISADHIDLEIIARLADFVRDHRKICVEYGQPKLAECVLI